jgi:hypothetical protein
MTSKRRLLKAVQLVGKTIGQQIHNSENPLSSFFEEFPEAKSLLYSRLDEQGDKDTRSNNSWSNNNLPLTQRSAQER